MVEYEPMKKPLTVRMAEALGWLYVILTVVLMVVSLFCYLYRGDFLGAVMSGVFYLCVLAFPAALILALRQGRRAWFVWPHTGVVLVVLMAALAIPSAVAAIIALILLVFPFVMLFRQEASRWFREMSIGRKPDKFGGWAAAVMLLIFVAFVGSVIPCLALPRNLYYTKAVAMAHRMRALFRLMNENDMAFESGKAWVDPAAYTNSADFIMALNTQFKDVMSDLGPHTNIWCVVVNPPDDDRFPVLFTSNLNPSDLFYDEGAHHRISLTCPKKWGGECFDFCEKYAAVIRKGGAGQIVKGGYSGGLLSLPKEKLAQLEAICILTPTGRVSFAALLPRAPHAADEEND